MTGFVGDCFLDFVEQLRFWQQKKKKTREYSTLPHRCSSTVYGEHGGAICGFVGVSEHNHLKSFVQAIQEASLTFSLNLHCSFAFTYAAVYGTIADSCTLASMAAFPSNSDDISAQRSRAARGDSFAAHAMMASSTNWGGMGHIV